MRGWLILFALAGCGDDNTPVRCWSQSADVHDEDGDGIRDACDNCPHLANADQRNADDDELGDACDADKATAACIVLFETFAVQPAIQPGTHGTWTIDNGALVQSDDALPNALWIVESTQRHSPIIITRAHVRSPSPPDEIRSVGFVHVMSDMFTDNFPDVGFLAELTNTRVAGGNDAAALHVAHFTSPGAGDDFFFQEIVPRTPMTMTAVDLSLDLSRSPIAIDVTHASAEHGATVTTLSALVPGRAGLRTHGLAAAFDYVLVVERCD